MSLLSSLLKKPIRAIEHKIELAKHDAKVEVSVALAKILVIVAIVFTLLLALAIASVGLAILINTNTGHPFAGYLYVGGGYVVLAILLYVINKTGTVRTVVKAYSDRIVFGKSGK
ncbi:hypothetical protein E1176_07065 [Fulvivirga sp. RKSG066]|uniref:phage holin family protein n=1 Tax=Fulvivirga aurantia TaxID=2529383 RepID=UPI0012BD32F4|nr:phage holin family protein [Fulvivirga aurantia]MTI20774.1 hypothetical protein [Fulvivirga aurantia]